MLERVARTRDAVIGRLVDQAPPAEALPSMAGRACLVTGATSGHGQAVAAALARLGAAVTLLGRSRERLAATRDAIQAQTGRAPEVLRCDLSRRQEIHRATRTLLDSGRPLHVLVNNAGLVTRQRQETGDGVELTFGVNYLAHFQLTVSLLPRLLQCGPARIVNVSSDTHRIVSLDLDDMQLRRGFSMLKAYGRSKLALVCFTRELARRLEGRPVTVNAVDPGPVESRIGQNNPGAARHALTVVMRLAFPGAEWAARSATYLAAAPEVAAVSGGYFKYGTWREPRLASPGPDDDLGRRLWQRSVALTGADAPL